MRGRTSAEDKRQGAELARSDRSGRACLGCDGAVVIENGFTKDPSLNAVLNAIARASIEVGRLTRMASLAGMLGGTGEVNVQGEAVQRLDVEGQRTFERYLRQTNLVAAMASEELEHVIAVADDDAHPYLVGFDPVDGSSNIDVAVTIGSIFGIYLRPAGAPLQEATFLRPGAEQLAAGYTLYGSSTMFVVATAANVDAYTLDPDVNRFRLTHSGIRFPDGCAYYSVNEHYFDRWSSGVQRAVSELRASCAARYVGSLVADFHRNLLKGGVFLYPGDSKSPAGKLRLLYEAAPLAFVAERAGGAASDGARRILDLTPQHLHQRTPLFVGSRDAVTAISATIRAADGAE